MIVIIGLTVLLIAMIIGIVGVLNNAGAAQPLTDDFSVFGYDVAGSTGTLFLYGIVVGAVAMLGMSMVLAGARRAVNRGQDARRELAQSRRETAFLNRDLAILHDRRSTRTAGVPTTEPTPRTSSVEGQTRRTRNRWIPRWSRVRRPVADTRRDATG